MSVRVRAASISSLTFRRADSLAVRSVVAEGFGRLLSFRVRNHNSVVVNLPSPVSRGVELTLVVSYAGRLDPLPTDREVARVDPGQNTTQEDEMQVPVEESYLYSNRSFWCAKPPSTTSRRRR
jgi:hypothetical protein